MSLKIIHRISLILLISNFAAASEENTGEYIPRVGNQGEYNRQLTDEEAIIANDFVHSGKIQRELEEACNADGDTRAACDGEEANAFGETGDLVFQTAAQMYSLFGLSGNGTITASDSYKETIKTDGVDGKKLDADEMKEQTEQADYCQYIPPGVSILAQGHQAMANNNIKSDVAQGQEAVAQREFLYKKERVHKERAKTASIEAAGWGSTAVCYIALTASTPFGLTDASGGTYFKIGAATFLTSFFYKRMKNNEKYAKKVKAIADALPGKGDCNPITERECYCSQEETSQDPQYCIPQIAGAPPAPPGFTRGPCINQNGQLDQACQCESSNTCLSQRFEPLFGGSFGNIGGAGSLITPARNLFRGRLQSGSLGGTIDQQQAFSKKALQDIDKKIDTAGLKLNDRQKRQAALLRNAGIPRRLAARLAATPASSRGLQLAKQSAISTMAPEVASSEYGATRNVFANKKTNKRVARVNPFKSNRRSGQNKDVLNFANQATKAQNRAIINRDRGKNVFEIITYRYQKSGWEKLDYILE